MQVTKPIWESTCNIIRNNPELTIKLSEAIRGVYVEAMAMQRAKGPAGNAS
jgi:hypothetical protein